MATTPASTPAMPTHCVDDGRSDNTSVANATVHTGPTARSGPAIDNGNRRSAEYASVHDTPTSTDLTITNPCIDQVIGATVSNDVHPETTPAR